MSDDDARDVKRARFDGFAQHVRSVVASIGDDFTEEDDDWAPVLQVINDDDEIFVFPVMTMSSEEEKDILANQMFPLLIQVSGGKLAAWVSSAWMSVFPKPDPDGPGGIVRPSLDPARREVVIVTVVDELRAELHTAEIIRVKGQPPTLDEWQMTGAGGGDALGGRFVEPLQDALRDSSGHANRAVLERLENNKLDRDDEPS